MKIERWTKVLILLFLNAWYSFLTELPFFAAFVGLDFSFGSSEPIDPGPGRIMIHNQCFKSGFIDFGCGSSILGRIPTGSRPGSRVLMTKNWRKKVSAEKKLYFFSSKIAIYLSLGLHKGRPSHRRSLQPSKENIPLFKTWNFLNFFQFLWVIFAFLDPDPDTTDLI